MLPSPSNSLRRSKVSCQARHRILRAEASINQFTRDNGIFLTTRSSPHGSPGFGGVDGGYTTERHSGFASGAEDLMQELKQPHARGVGRNRQYADGGGAGRHHETQGNQAPPALSSEVTFTEPEIVVANHSCHPRLLSQLIRGVPLLSEAGVHHKAFYHFVNIG
jgi:hypothetical protein